MQLRSTAPILLYRLVSGRHFGLSDGSWKVQEGSDVHWRWQLPDDSSGEAASFDPLVIPGVLRPRARHASFLDYQLLIICSAYELWTDGFIHQRWQFRVGKYKKKYCRVDFLKPTWKNSTYCQVCQSSLLGMLPDEGARRRDDGMGGCRSCRRPPSNMSYGLCM